MERLGLGYHTRVYVICPITFEIFIALWFHVYVGYLMRQFFIRLPHRSKIGMFLGTYGAEMLGEFGGMTGAALTGSAAEAVAGKTSVYRYEAGNLPGSFRTGNSFAGSPQNMTDAQRIADISDICSDLKDFSVNQVITSPNAINSFTRRAEARLHDLAVEIESRYPGDSRKQQEEFEKQMEPVAREELRSCVIREAFSSRHTMINKGYLEKSEVYRDIEDGFMEEYFRVQSLNNINGYLQNGDEQTDYSL